MKATKCKFSRFLISHSAENINKAYFRGTFFFSGMDASLRLRFVQHDKSESVIPSGSEESSMDASLRLRFVQHDKSESVIPSDSEESSMDASLRLRFVQHDKSESVIISQARKFRALFSVIPSQSEESSEDVFAT